MALEPKRAAVNTAVDTLIAAWNDLVDGLSPGDKLQVVFPISDRGGTAASFAGVGRQVTYRIEVPQATNDASIRWTVPNPALAELFGGIPLFFKCTNDAGELS